MSATIKVITAPNYLKLVQRGLPNLVTLDCTWYPSDKDGYVQYTAEHIAGARYFPFTEIKTESPYPHMMPKDFGEFAHAASKLGLRSDNYVVVYDQATYLSAPRVAWLLSTFGHQNVFLLDNYKAYKNLNGPLESGESPKVAESQYAPDSSEPQTIGKWLEYEDVVNLIKSNQIPEKYNLIDARGAARYSGSQPEPRPGVQSGHIVGSKNIPFTEVVSEDGHFKSKDDLTTIFKSRGLDPEKPSIVLCGSGVTACVVKAALDNAFGGSADIYDGSWAEWGQRAPADLIEKS